MWLETRSAVCPDISAAASWISCSRPRQLTPLKVEGEVQGEDESVQKLLRDIDRGPRLAHVVKLETTEKDVKAEEAAFDVR